MEKKKSRYRRQFGALPLRMDETGTVEVMMMTSRETHRWIVPKGWPIKGLSGRETAAREAEEEAGVIGITGKSPVGGFMYDKRLKSGSSTRCYVELYPLWVVEKLQVWPEQGERMMEWLPVDQAAERAGDASLGELLRHVAQEVASNGLPRASHKLYRKARQRRKKLDS